ncbi:MAG: S1C family serine protease [Acidimicrobiia bacterium]
MVVASLAAGAVGGRLAAGGPGDDAGTVATATPVSSTSLGDTMDIAAVLDALEGSVVSIQTTVQARRGPYVTEGESAGTGIVIDDGLVLTNAHVVAGATSITVTLDGQDAPRTATVVGADTARDIAVLRVADAEGLVPVAIADSGTTAVGDPVIAVGNALALEGSLTVTQGIVSALDRSIQTEDGVLDGLVQTDAAISSGNSGGPLVNAKGEVVGINTAVAASSGGVQASNVGFAISIDQALDVAARLAGGSSGSSARTS